MRRRARVTVRRGPGLVGTMARTAVIAGTATAAVGAVSGASRQQAAVQQQTSQQLAELQAQQEMLAAQQQAVAAEAEAPAMNSFDEQLVQIQKLSMLMEQGLLTEEEFQAKKRQVLGI
jgi:hypothetical protein